MDDQLLIDFINNECGSVQTFAKKAGLTSRAIYKWTAKNALPRTEFTEETKYSEILEELSGVPASEIRDMFKPLPSTEACD